MISVATQHDTSRGNTIGLAWIAILTALLPILVVHLCWATAVYTDHLRACNPYLTGCISISATGRYGMSYFLFKAGMLPAAVVLAIYWLLCRQWLLALGDPDGPATRWIVRVGLIAVVFLILYTVFLGSRGDFYALMRRYGVTVYYSFNFLAQLLLIARLRDLAAQGMVTLPGWILHGKLILLIFLLALGLISIPVQHLMPEGFRRENILEWNFSLLSVTYYLLTAAAWRLTGFRARLSVAARAG